MNIFFDQSARGTSQRPDFAVVGGGLCGRLVAWQLAGAGHRVALYERGDAAGTQSAAWVAAAMLAPLAEAASAELLITELGAASLERWPRLIAELPEPVFFQRNGTLVVWHAGDRAEAPLFERRLRANAPAALFDDGFVKLAGAQVAATEPSLGTRFAQGWLLPHEGQLDNRQVLSALAAGLSARGVETHWHTAIDAMPDARIVIDCRGLGAKPAWPALRGIRGEVARVHAPGIGLTRPVRLLHPRYPLYIAPKENDLYVIGATEVEGEDMSPVTRALGARAAERGVRRASRFRRGAHSRTQCPVPPDAARSPARHRLGRGANLACQRSLPARLHDRAGSRRQRRALRRGAARARRLRHRFLRRFPPPERAGRRCFTVNMPCPRSR